MAPAKIPVTVVTGFLGAGKTTLVNHLLAQCSGTYIGIIVNEFGEVGIDGQLIVADDQPLIEITNGCVCCTVRKDLTAALNELLQRAERPIERLIIETSGLADPAPVLQSFLADAALLQRVELESVVTVADAHHILLHVDDDIVREQIAFADVVVLNKVETASPQELERLERELRRLNPVAYLIRTERAQVPAAELLGAKRFSLPHVLSIEPDLLDGEAHDHEHDTSISSCCMETDGAIDPERFSRWMNQLVQSEAARLMRTKGVLNFNGEARQFHCHSVHMLLDARPGRRWGPDEQRRSKLVFIGRELAVDALREGFLGCLAIQPKWMPAPAAESEMEHP
ncbi:GTP-binding protein [Variovorax guangxiensis]|uniref:CobW family GTP-binding protein n=1 Tax=Variovorax guangxiensis TaxID=1775474 RepID=UPI002856EB51|nr:GTP-binding protein [Variovorax guangxiensis]MDR6858738.1 G3E family GTPase [Variovorax guangxiensis]